ncbi:hypothetical protein [Joostella sp. CR20]|uniref:hypothetical protein n=1 Tax=Joostella sp. CR20 TaxID=2804312 RepID=UPI00313B8649
MDLSSITWGVIIFAACLIPLILLGSQIKRNSKKLLTPILEEVKQRQGKITVYEQILDVCFAMDEQQNVLYYYRETSEKNELKTIYLKDLETSKLNIQRKSENKNRSTTVTKIVIELQKDSKTVDNLIVYDINESKQLIPEVLYAEKWNRLINSKL